MLGDRRGYTIVELLAVVAILAVISLAVSQLFFPMAKFFQRGRVQQKASLEARICLETIQRVMSNGKAITLVISTPPTTPTVQSSRADFQGVDGSSYTVTWSTSPMNTVHLQRIAPGSSVTTDTVLATNVAGFSFSWNMNDPAVVNLSIQIRTPVDTSGAPDSFRTLFLPSQTIQMVGS